MVISRRLEDMRNLAVRAAFAPAPLAALITEARQEASRRADSPALAAECAAAAEEGFTAVAEAMAAADGVSPDIPG
jgi:hypothetical protein